MRNILNINRVIFLKDFEHAELH